MITVSNPQLDLAYAYVSQTNKNLFLTGKAGTGKTTFLRRVRREISKRMAVVAPTGVAAINAEGVTIHSLFQLPFGPLVPDQLQEMLRQRRYNGEKIKLFKSLDLLIIDEISMVRADLLDAIDAVLRRYRDYTRPFGGIQLLMIGDLHQLSPVVKDQEWDLLRPFYRTAYFFGSLALQQTNAVTVELQHIYRQADQDFIDILNRVRGNRMDAEIMEILNSRYRPDFQPEDQSGYITLSSHNATAQAINTEKLQRIPGLPRRFKATIEGDFPAYAYPTEVELSFKINAQVMFVKNDLSTDKRYYNGKIGRITRIDQEEIHVRCPDDERDIVVTTTEWHNRKYTLNETTKEVYEEIIGTFTQFPLKLAWAITIHKSQGLTFERVIIDAEAAFAHGQVYVALSRCKTFEGIVLRTQLAPKSIRTDSIVREYTEEARQNEPDEEQLFQARKEYQQGLLTDFFQFKKLQLFFNQLHRLTLEHEQSLPGGLATTVKTILDNTQEKVLAVGEKFVRQLQVFWQQPELPDANEAVLERLGKAGAYFTEQLLNEIVPAVNGLQPLTDNQAVRKKVEEKLEEVRRELFILKAGTQALSKGFEAENFVRCRIDAELDFKYTARPATASRQLPADVPHPELYQQLVQWRAATADQENLERYTVMPTKTILEIVQVLPTNGKSLKRIHGIGKLRADQYGPVLLQMVTDYCQKHQLKTDQVERATGKAPKAPKPPKPDTKWISLEMFRNGKKPDAIAEDRGLVKGTIQGHLAHYIGLGKLDIFELVEPAVVEQVTTFFKTTGGESLAEAKTHFGSRFEFGELKMIQAYWQHQQQQSN